MERASGGHTTGIPHQNGALTGRAVPDHDAGDASTTHMQPIGRAAMSTVPGFVTACLEIAGALFLTRWARPQEYELTAMKLNWPSETVHTLNRRKWRNLWGFLVAMACAVAIWLLTGRTVHHQPYTLGPLVTSGGAVAFLTSFGLDLWWVRRWRRSPGWPPLPQRSWCA